MRHKRSLAGATLAVLIAVAVAATALANTPKKGARFTGTLTDQGIRVVEGKYHAMVSFTVSSSGTKLTAFKYQDLGCFGAGGFGNRNPYTFPGSTKSFKPIPVSASGAFTSPATKDTHKSVSVIVTTSGVTGTFPSPKHAIGEIAFSQTLTYKGKTQSCGPVTLTFSAKAH
ncbi:MAG TPA: hypothetical protein VG186_12990 [Solirubrobacteraceae bacterium]|jgi:hypothetical protein|nr:hypothetical protein [Solirubrobacteraceae bacterium]